MRQISLSPNQPLAVNEFKTCDHAFRRGRVNQLAKGKSDLLFSEVHLGTLFFGSGDSPMASYKTDWVGWGGSVLYEEFWYG